ncbi:hypothetical protein SEUCBS139899_008503 [Sporothrix eucalyptigena]|uniref:Rieske domain-containing protein n=1 Tax=Sporothrix eucalyptigena TaxID=1812306 RepID=A0ABP0CBB1_9PEZI
MPSGCTLTLTATDRSSASSYRTKNATHTWAIAQVGNIVEKLGIDCEYRRVPGYEISQYPRGDAKHDKDLEQLKTEAELASQLGVHAAFQPDLEVGGWLADRPDQRGGAVFQNQAAFHPPKYLIGILEWLKKQDNFECYTNTRVTSVDDDKNKPAANSLSSPGSATTAPTAFALRIPKGTVEDCFVYDSAKEHKYVRLTRCDDENDYLVVGGCDHEVGHEAPDDGRFEELETWARERFPVKDGGADYRWSGQIQEPVDYMAYIGKNQGNECVYIVTGDSGNGLTHGVIAGRLIADEIDGVTNSWATLYSPKRVASVLSSAGSVLTHGLKINAQYKRHLQSDLQDIEDLLPGEGGVLNSKTSKPVAVYRDESGKVSRMSAQCPHLKGVVCWNAVEKSFDCPVHGSRFSNEGVCVMGPAKANLTAVE